MDTKQSPTSLGLSFRGGVGGGFNCLVVFPAHFNPNNFFFMLLQISLLFMWTRLKDRNTFFEPSSPHL